MRFAIAFATAFTLALPAFAQEEPDAYVWPTPQISDDISALPVNVQATRAALINAARTGDIEKLRPIIEEQEFPPNVSFGEFDDPLDYLKFASEDDDGRQILGLLVDLLDQPYAFYPDSGGEITYIWPYLSEIDPNALTPDQQVDAYRLLNTAQLEEMKEFGAWYYWRLYIKETGEWTVFVAGD